MAEILIIHGIANEYLGENELLSAWYPALCDGLNRANYPNLPRQDECFCPFYGDLFRKPGHLGFGQTPEPEDVERASEDEISLLKAIWIDAAQNDPAVPGPAAYTSTLVWAPSIAQRALNALAKSKFLADYLPLHFLGDLKQVVLYLNDADVHSRILEMVKSRIQPETKIVIGHSLGSVVGYEAVCAKPGNVETLLTLGSPLGIRNVVFDKLTPKPMAAGLGHWPGNVKWWTNIAAKLDPVAAQKKLAPLFGNEVQDWIIDNAWDAHSSTRYLNTKQAGEAIARSL